MRYSFPPRSHRTLVVRAERSADPLYLDLSAKGFSENPMHYVPAGREEQHAVVQMAADRVLLEDLGAAVVFAEGRERADPAPSFFDKTHQIGEYNGYT